MRQNTQTLREFLATLKEADFGHGVTEPITVPAELDDMEELYRNWMMSLDVQSLIGSKRGFRRSVPPRLFVLSSIEGGQQVMVPPVWPKP